jgi:short-subunit dehydrogenase
MPAQNGQQERQVVLITGATSGIGKATAELLATHGCRVLGTSRNPAGKTMPGYELLPLEVTDDASVAACVSQAAERTGGRIDVLINNAGTGIIGAAEETSPEEALRLFQINFFGVMRMTNAVLPLMRAQGRGLLINMSSTGGVVAVPFGAFYCATKFALEGYTAALRQELEPLGIYATVVAPGPVSTPAGDTAMRASQTIAAYAARRQHFDAQAVHAIRHGMAPARVAHTIWQILRTQRPAPRYRVGLQSRLTESGKTLLPARTFEKLTRWTLGLS